MVVKVTLSRLHWTEFGGVWTTANPWKKEAEQPDWTAEGPAGGDGEMCCYGMENVCSVAH